MANTLSYRYADQCSLVRLDTSQDLHVNTDMYVLYTPLSSDNVQLATCMQALTGQFVSQGTIVSPSPVMACAAVQLESQVWYASSPASPALFSLFYYTT